MAQLTYTGSLTIIACGHCSMDHAVPESFLAARKRDGETFWCPAGHKMSYGEGETARLRRLLGSAQARATHEHDQRQAAERSAAAYKGRVTRLKNRAAAGVCPCCSRSFENLRRHMTSKHPGYADTGADA